MGKYVLIGDSLKLTNRSVGGVFERGWAVGIINISTCTIWDIKPSRILLIEKSYNKGFTFFKSDNNNNFIIIQKDKDINI